MRKVNVMVTFKVTVLADECVDLSEIMDDLYVTKDSGLEGQYDLTDSYMDSYNITDSR